MSSYKEHLLINLEKEIVLLKRLAAEVGQNDLAFRPAEKMRSTEELLRYVAGVAAYMLRWFTEDLTPEAREKIREYNKTLDLENVQQRLDEQWATIQHVMDGITEEDLLVKEVTLPWKEKMVLGAAIMHAPLRWLTTYRMQLFMYLKMNGHEELGTADAWVTKIADVAG